MSPRFVRIAFVVFSTLLPLGTGVVRADSQSVMPPLPPAGPYPIGCSNIAQDFSRVMGGEDASQYWEGAPRDNGSGRYITDLLSESSNSLVVNMSVPNDSTLYGEFAQ